MLPISTEPMPIKHQPKKVKDHNKRTKAALRTRGSLRRQAGTKSTRKHQTGVQFWTDWAIKEHAGTPIGEGVPPDHAARAVDITDAFTLAVPKKKHDHAH